MKKEKLLFYLIVTEVMLIVYRNANRNMKGY